MFLTKNLIAGVYAEKSFGDRVDLGDLEDLTTMPYFAVSKNTQEDVWRNITTDFYHWEYQRDDRIYAIHGLVSREDQHLYHPSVTRMSCRMTYDAEYCDKGGARIMYKLNILDLASWKWIAEIEMVEKNYNWFQYGFTPAYPKPVLIYREMADGRHWIVVERRVSERVWEPDFKYVPWYKVIEEAWTVLKLPPLTDSAIARVGVAHECRISPGNWAKASLWINRLKVGDT